MHRAFGALQSMIGRGQQQFGGGLHCGCALAHGSQDALDACAECTDRDIDGAAPLLALAQRIALLLRGELLGDVGMGGEPAAAAHRAADQRDEAAVLELDGPGFGSIFRGLAQAIGNIVSGVAVEIAGSKPVQQQIAQRRSRARMLSPQVIHVDVDLVAQHQARGAVEHAQPLRHVVERGAKQSRLRSAPAVDEQSRDRRRAEPKRQSHDERSHGRRRLRQRGDSPRGSAQCEDHDPEQTAAGAGHEHERPVAAELRKIGHSSKHRVPSRDKRRHLAADRLF
jgi:hypothetical protein